MREFRRTVARRGDEIYFHLVNDTVRTTAVLRQARAMQWAVIRLLLSVIATAPARIVNRLTDTPRERRHGEPKRIE